MQQLQKIETADFFVLLKFPLGIDFKIHHYEYLSYLIDNLKRHYCPDDKCPIAGKNTQGYVNRNSFNAEVESIHIDFFQM